MFASHGALGALKLHAIFFGESMSLGFDVTDLVPDLLLKDRQSHVVKNRLGNPESKLGFVGPELSIVPPIHRGALAPAAFSFVGTLLLLLP